MRMFNGSICFIDEYSTVSVIFLLEKDGHLPSIRL